MASLKRELGTLGITFLAEWLGRSDIAEDDSVLDVVNDGTPTLLTYKGDGAQSLAALAILRYASERGARGKNLVVAIEEPESH